MIRETHTLKCRSQVAKEQRRLNEESEKIGLRDLDGLHAPPGKEENRLMCKIVLVDCFYSAGDDKIVVGGVFDPELGEARLFKTTTREEMIDTGHENVQRRVKTITEDTKVMGKDDPNDLEMEMKTVTRKLGRHDWEVQPDNPLYASQVSCMNRTSTVPATYPAFFFFF